MYTALNKVIIIIIIIIIITGKSIIAERLY